MIFHNFATKTVIFDVKSLEFVKFLIFDGITKRSKIEKFSKFYEIFPKTAFRVAGALLSNKIAFFNLFSSVDLYHEFKKSLELKKYYARNSFDWESADKSVRTPVQTGVPFRNRSAVS